MNTSFEQTKNSTVEWYTPPEIIRCLGEFDLDPATSETAININNSAWDYYTKDDDGLKLDWYGRIWLNPPYRNPFIKLFMEKMAKHNNGIALVYNRCDSAWFQDYVLNAAHSLLFLCKRIYFIRPDGTEGNRPGAGSVLIAYGSKNTEALKNSGLEGKIVYL